MKRSSLLTRREFLKASGLAAAAAALAACNPLPFIQAAAATSKPGLTPTAVATPIPTPGSADALVSRLVRRITFGVQPADLAHAQEIGFDNFIDEQLAPDTIADDHVASRLAGLTTLSMSPAQLLAVNPPQQSARELMQATILRAVFSRRQLNELLVDFWSNHFNIYLAGNVQAYLKPVDDREAIRPHVLGKFHDLLSASAHSPAMLVYLNNAVSTKNMPNENYGRELMELHTLSVNGGYTQTDVHEAARALTGWTVRGKNAADAGTFYFNAGVHDDGAKLILGQPFPAGQGIADGDQLLELLAQHLATAHFISLKLARRFVADDPPASVVASAEAAFTQSGGDIAKVMGAILHSDEFRASLGQKIKRPFEFVASALRATQAAALASDPTLNMLRLMGQPLFGWQTPDGFPDVAGAWVSTNGMLARWNYSLALAFNALKDSPVDLTGVAGSVTTVDEATRALSQAFLGEPLPDTANQILRDAVSQTTVQAALPALAALIIGSPYFQYR